MKLRPYQDEGVNGIKASFVNKHKNVIFCLPTGGGKTVCFTSIAKRTVEASGKKVLILTHRIELMQQATQSIMKNGMRVGFIIAGGSMLTRETKVIIGTVETYYRRLKRGMEIDNLGLIIIDEAHRGEFKKIIDHHSDVRIIGATATPISSTKKDPLKNYFSDIVVGTDIPELIKLGFLSTPTYFAVPLSFEITAKVTGSGDYREKDLFNDFNKKVLYDGCVENYRIHAVGKKTIVFCVNIEHSEKTTEAFNNAGFSAKCVTSSTDDSERKAILRWFANSKDGVLVNCGILTTGYDEPTIECVILNRATKSLPLYLQMIGRGGRVVMDENGKPIKNTFSVIDMGDNLHTHGRWEMPRNWKNIFENPEKPKPPKDEDDISLIKFCPNEECNKKLHISAKICDNCGHLFSKGSAEEPKFALTKKVTPEEFAHLFDTPPEQMNVDELIIRAEMGNKETGQKYKKGWILRQLKQKEDSRAALEEYAQKMGYKKKWIEYQINKDVNTKTL